jgi:uncharacterized protein (DUF1015 family)
MAEVQPLHALHYNLEKTGGLQDVVAPPYDVIDAEQRARLAAKSPYNVVHIDLPEGDGDRYEHAAATLTTWRASEVVVQDETPALWGLSQAYTGPDGRGRTRHGFLTRVRVEPYGPGRIRPHERTHPGPREDRLRLTRATKANLSPIFALFSDPDRGATDALAGNVDRPWAEISAVQAALTDTELLIADGHHRYETARVYADEIGGEGPHRYVLMCLVALEDPGLTVFPTHRLVRGLRPDQHESLANALQRAFEIEELEDTAALAPASSDEVKIGYIDSHFRRPFVLTLKDKAAVDAALPQHAEPYRNLDTAVLEALILKGALEMTDEDIDHLSGLGYARDNDHALELVQRGEYDAAFLMAPTPVERIQQVAAAGESMPPKSTYFFPKIPTGLLFNPLT